ncbi:unnamed protein product, partial [Arctogadus glacialis]
MKRKRSLTREDTVVPNVKQLIISTLLATQLPQTTVVLGGVGYAFLLSSFTLPDYVTTKMLRMFEETEAKEKSV